METRRHGESHRGTVSLCHRVRFFSGKSQLPPVVTQKRNDRGQEDHHDNVNGMGNFHLRNSPDDENRFENEEKDRKLDLSFHKVIELGSVIDPPGEDSGNHRKRGRDGSQNEKIETGDLERPFLKQESQKAEKRGRHEESDRKMDDHRMGVAPRHWKSLKKILEKERKVF